MVRPDGFVLAGGRSRRMGFDKARAPWGSEPMAIAVLEALRPVCGRVALVRRGVGDGLPWVGRDGASVEVLWEPDEGDTHPLFGVATALKACRTDTALIAPCDVPGLQADGLRALLEAAPAVAFDGQRRHPLVAALPRTWVEAALRGAVAGERVHDFTAAANSVLLPSTTLHNLNDRAALGPDPIGVLLDRLPLLTPEARDRVAAGERARLAARGVLLYAPSHEEGS